MSRAEDSIIDLRLAASALLQATDKNSADIAQLIEVSRNLLEVSRRHSDELGTLQSSQTQTEEAIRDIRAATQRVEAAIERMDRLFDYLIRRDQGQLE
jgi:transposase-like protein